MICKAGVFLDSSTTFRRFIEDCKITCEVITPHLLAAPFFRGSYVALIVPTGFANRKYSLLLPVLRAKKDRIHSFLERGGRLLVFGAAEARSDAYDWLPFPVEYHHAYEARHVTLPEDWGLHTLLEGYDCTGIPCDGTFPSHGGDVVGVTRDGDTVLVGKQVGEGYAVVTSVHEYPSRKFLREFACGEKEIPL
ncbi:MAG: hypothetical protein LUO93_05290 [Methanomicrobiales archaeon]|nr:hypothetical protein [Methanomicrobiales archaeon]